MSNWYWCFVKNSTVYYTFITNCQIFIINTFRLIETFWMSYDWWSRNWRFTLTTGLSDKINIPIRFVQYKDLFYCIFFYVRLPVWRKRPLLNPCSSFWCQLGGRSHSATRFRHPACLRKTWISIYFVQRKTFTWTVVLNTWLA